MRTTARERRAEALTRAVTGQTLSNYPAIFQGFMVMGIAEAEGLDGQPIARYEQLARDSKNNMRRMLMAVESGVMVSD